MTNQLSAREWEAISAYLDDQLKPRQRSRLEARMRSDPEFRAAVDSLRQTRTLLRSIPAVRAPRNFTLTPNMAKRPSLALRLAPTFRLATVVATLLFALLVAGDLSGFLLPGASQVAQRVLSEPQAAMTPPEAAEFAQMEEADVVVTETVAMPAEALQEEPPAAAMEGAAVEEPVMEAAPAEPLLEKAESDLGLEETAPVERLQASQTELAMAATATPEATPLEPPAPSFASEDQISLAGAPGPVSPGQRLIRTLEYILAGVAVGSGVLALLLRRRNA